MDISILVADSLHINRRNFSSFFNFIEKNKIKIHFEDSHKDWIALYGSYDSKLSILLDKIEILLKLDKDDLFNYTVYDQKLFNVCRAEVLSLVASQEIWYKEKYPNNSNDLFEKIYKHNRTILLQNMAAAWYWIDFWKKRLSELPQFSFCCIFSGSLVYQKSLIEILKHTSTKVILMESLFTGNEYYCEESYSHIANNSSIKHISVYKNYVKKLKNLDENIYDRERIKAINKVILANNKNVEQPIESEDINFKYSLEKTITIIGQVINDFSVLEYNNIGISTICFYKELILSLSNAGYNVVFKAHPWEEKKNNIKESLTKNIMLDYVEKLPSRNKDRIKILDHYNIDKLFLNSDWVVGLNSQGLLEASFEGFKTVTFGNPFYGKKGFTHDYDLSQINTFIEDLKAKKISNILTLDELDKFELFLTILLQYHCVSIHNSGVSKLVDIFSPFSTIPLAKKQPKRDEVPVSVISTKSAIKPEVKPNNPQPITANVYKKDNVTIESIEPKKDLTTNNDIKSKKIKAKFNKFKTHPWQFFADSKSPAVRILRYFVKKR